jgi:anti-sigma factor RsiW
MAITCEQVARRLTELEEGGGSAAARLGLRAHLAICRRCQRYVEQMKQVRSSLSTLREGTVAEASLERALATFRNAGR